jgi:flagellar biosynthesis protein FlhG
LNFYELLEITPKANSQEIHKAYERVRKIYDPNSIALYSLFTNDETTVIHQRIEDAYRTLMYENKRKKYDELLKYGDALPELPVDSPSELFAYRSASLQAARTEELQISSKTADNIQTRPISAPVKQEQEEQSPVSPFISEFTGPVMKVLREQRKLTIKNIADMTKIGSRYLDAMEEENYEKLPARPYLRGFLMLYAKTLGYEPERVANDYLKRYDAVKAKPK